MSAFRSAACLAAALLLAAQGSAAAARHRSHAVFFNHAFAVLDAETADAIEHSEYLRNFALVEVRTTTANDGETWRGRYLTGRQTYLEFFGPGDLRGPGGPGTTAVAISPDAQGGLAAIKTGLARLGIPNPDTGRRTRKFGTDRIAWFDFVSPPGEGLSLSAWAMEYVPSYFDDKRAGHEPADYPGDISRERYQPDAYMQKQMRDVSVVEIACPAQDTKAVLALVGAAGFDIRKGRDRIEASDGATSIILDIVPPEQAGLRRIVFELNAPAEDAHIETIGRSTLIVGPGSHAVWTFQARGQ